MIWSPEDIGVSTDIVNFILKPHEMKLSLYQAKVHKLKVAWGGNALLSINV